MVHSAAEVPWRARRGRLDPEYGLALNRSGDRPGRADPGLGPVQDGPEGTRVCGCSHVGGRDVLGQIGEAEQDAGTDARA